MNGTDWKLLCLYLILLTGFTIIGLVLSDDGRQKEICSTQAVTDAAQDLRIEAMEKEIRLLKTDIQILQNGSVK